MMSKLSIKYELSQRYTNHSIRVTGLQSLEDANIEGRHIIRISGHKNEQSIKNYARKLSAARKRNISSILSGMVDEQSNPLSMPPAKETKIAELPALPAVNTVQHHNSLTLGLQPRPTLRLGSTTYLMLVSAKYNKYIL